jgi:NADH-quinone oxidoreductase subunit L
MTVPMVLLGIGSFASGFLLLHVLKLQEWLVPSLGEQEEVGLHTISPTVLTLLTLLVVAGGVGGAWYAYGTRPVPTTPPIAVTPFTVAARKNLYFDALNESVLMRPGQYLTRFLVWLDNRGIDGAVNALAAGIGGGSGRLRRVQTGFVRSYALSMFGGALLVVAALLAVRLGQ